MIADEFRELTREYPKPYQSEFDKWDLIIRSHPDFIAEQRSEQEALQARHLKRNMRALEDIRRLVQGYNSFRYFYASLQLVHQEFRSEPGAIE